jgi:hypothetical protein
VGVAVLVAVLPSPARAEATGAGEGVQTYVSARFKTVARRAFRELLTAQLAKSCPEGKQAVCAAVVARATEALDAALNQDDAAVKAALDGLLVEASVNGVLASALAGLHDTGDEKVRALVAPLVTCVAAALADRPLRQACALGKPAPEFIAQWVEVLGPGSSPGKSKAAVRVARYVGGLATAKPIDVGDARSALGELGFEGADADRVNEFLGAVASGGRIEPALAVHALAAVASLEVVNRPDLRVYLRRFAFLLEQRVELGLFEATLRFLAGDLTAKSGDGYTIGILADYLDVKDTKPSWTMKPDDTARLRAALVECKQPTTALDDWAAGREAYLKDLRRAAILGRRLDFGPVDRLLAYHTDCGPEAQTTIRAFQADLRYFVGPVKSYALLSRYGAPALALAALLDYVRTRDEERLDRDLRRAALYAVAQVGTQRRNVLLLHAEDEDNPDTHVRSGSDKEHKKKLAWVGDAIESCEIRGLETALEVELTGHAVPPEQCVPLLDGPRPPDEVRSSRATLASWVTSGQVVKPVLAYSALDVSERGFFSDADTAVVERALEAYVAADPGTGRRIMIRMGVDLLAAHVDTFVGSITGADEDACVRDYKTTVLWSPLALGCSAHMLIVSAYRPIADYYWGTGTGASREQVTSTVYRELLDSPILDHTPIILNLGVGGTWITGRSDWGRDGYAALTVLDKVGLAVVKVNGTRSRFETGLFVGGFLDALVRTAADVGKQERYWLAGATVGWPRIRGVNIGLEAHVGAAMPFQFGGQARYGFAMGAAVVVPFTWVFEEEGSK